MLHALVSKLRTLKYNWSNLGKFRTHYAGGRWTIDTWDGEHLTFDRNTYLSFLEIYGYLNELRWRLEPGQNVLDAGACFGEFSLYAARRVGPGGKVVMLEPDPANLRIFEENCRLNGGKPANLIVLPFALWNRTETLRFATGLGGASGLVDTAVTTSTTTDTGAASAPSAQVTLVDATDLGTIAARAGIASFDFIKMDIEGAEVEICAHEAERFKRDRTRVAIASYHRREGRPTSELIEPALRAAGLHVWTGFPIHPVTYVEPADRSTGRSTAAPS